MDSGTRPPWFALKVRTRSELLVSSVLRSKTFETFVPTWKQSLRYSDRTKCVDAALFPGYLFCRLDPTQPRSVLSTPGVAYILGANNSYTPLNEQEVVALQCLMTSGLNAKPWPFLKAGSKVRVEVGAMSGVEAIVIAEKGVSRLVLSVELLQRSVAVEIDRSWIRPA